MMIQITRPEVEALIEQRLQAGGFQDVEDVIFRALQLSSADKPLVDAERAEAIVQLREFGKAHKLSLDGMTIRELRQAARP